MVGRSSLLCIGKVALGLGVLVGRIPAQTPGDQSVLKAVHPGYTLSSLTPAGFEPGVSGLDFLSDGRLVVCTWGGTHAKLTPPSKNGDVYILDHVDQEDSSKVTYKKFASGLQEPLGLKVVNDTIYVTERQALAMLVDKNKDGVMDTNGYHKVAAFTTGIPRHEFFFGLVYKDGFFYGAQSLSLNSGPSFVPQPEGNRGTYVKIEKATGKAEYISGGAREPFGMNINPRGEIWSTEVQGSWNPANGFTLVRPGRFYGHPLEQQVPPSPFDTMPYNPPAVQLPETEIANAPGQPVYINSGIFKDQYFYGDESYGGIQRIFLEKVEGEYQGAVFRFSAGFTGGVSRLAWAPNGDLIVGEIGDEGGGNWLELGKQAYGLQKLKPNGKTAFEMLSIKSRPKGMEIEFTEPVAANANLASNYQVKSWYYVRTKDYGGPKVDPQDNKITSVTVSPDNRKVYLEVSGLQKGRVVYVRLAGLKSSAGKAPWSTEGWYTLNAIGTGNPFDTTVTALQPNEGGLSKDAFTVARVDGKVYFQVTVAGEYGLKLTDARGAVRRSFRGKAPGMQGLDLAGLARGNYVVTLAAGGRTLSKPLAIY